MNDTATARAGRCCAVAAALTTAGAAAAVVALAEPTRWALVAVLVGAILWGIGGPLAVALTPTRRRSLADGDGPVVRLGTVMRLGDVPDEVARTTSALAASSGPVALVVPSNRDVPARLDPAVVVVRHADPDAADPDAADPGAANPDAADPDAADPDAADPAPPDPVAALDGRCDAVLFVSARALPSSGCSDAASKLAAGASWVVGAAEPLNRDHFGPTGRELLDARLRRHASAAGLWCWESDATVVRASLLRAHPLPAARPLGSWLRARACEGLVGATVDTPLARRAAPVAAEGYWPDATARQRGAAADLADAATAAHSGRRVRAVATGLLLRALSGWSIALWLAALVLFAGGSPVRRGDGAIAALVAAAVVLRWLALHLAAGTRPAPVADVVAGLYALPGSLLATTSAVRRRVSSTSRRVPTRPLVWLALVATAAAASVVLTARPGDAVARIAAGAAAALLVLLWVFTVRSLVERSWRRIGFRIPLDLAAVVEDPPTPASGPGWRLVDGSPGGFAVAGPTTGLDIGDEVTVRVPRPVGDALVLDGTVAGRRPGGRGGRGGELLGIELRAVAPDTGTWAATLVDGASEAPGARPALVDERVDGADGESTWGRRIDRAAVGMVVAVSLVVALTLALVLAGLRPLTIRSGSMEPTYSVGDVVLVASTAAGDLRPGEVVTRFDAPEATDSLTHRVQDVSRDGGVVAVTTRGDANESTEDWVVPADRQVGRVVASVPAVGVPLTAVRSSIGWALAAGLAVLGVIAVLLRPRGRREPGAATAGETFNPADHVPTDLPTAGPRATRTGSSHSTGERP